MRTEEDVLWQKFREGLESFTNDIFDDGRDQGLQKERESMGELVEVTVRIDADIYKKAEAICSAQGMTFEAAILLFVHETVRLGRLPFELTKEDWEYARKLEEAESEVECTDTRFSSEEVLGVMKAEIEDAAKEAT